MSLSPADRAAADRDVALFGTAFILRDRAGGARRLDPATVRRLDKAAHDMAAARACTLEEAVATIRHAIETDMTAIRRVRAWSARQRLRDHFALLDP